nr:hypothetical protein [Candidatus Nitrosacidococcus sp. I8]
MLVALVINEESRWALKSINHAMYEYLWQWACENYQTR